LDKGCEPTEISIHCSISENEGVVVTFSPLNGMESILGAALMKTGDVINLHVLSPCSAFGKPSAAEGNSE